MQTTLPPAQIAIGMTLLIFGQTSGRALFIALAQTVLSHSLVNRLKEHAPTVNPQTVIAVGATAFHVVEPDQILGVREAYTMTLDNVFYLSSGTAVGTFIFAVGMGLVAIRKKEAIDTNTAATPPSQIAEV